MKIVSFDDVAMSAQVQKFFMKLGPGLHKYI